MSIHSPLGSEPSEIFWQDGIQSPAWDSMTDRDYLGLHPMYQSHSGTSDFLNSPRADSMPNSRPITPFLRASEDLARELCMRLEAVQQEAEQNPPESQLASKQTGPVPMLPLTHPEQLCREMTNHFWENQYSCMRDLKVQEEKLNSVLHLSIDNYWAWCIAYRLAQELKPLSVLGEKMSALHCLYRAHFHCKEPEQRAFIKNRLESELSATQDSLDGRMAKKQKVSHLFRDPLFDSGPAKSLRNSQTCDASNSSTASSSNASIGTLNNRRPSALKMLNI